MSITNQRTLETKDRIDFFEMRFREAKKRLNKCPAGTYLLLPGFHYSDVEVMFRMNKRVALCSFHVFNYEEKPAWRNERRLFVYDSLDSAIKNTREFVLNYSPWMNIKGYISPKFKSVAEEELCKKPNGSYFFTDSDIPYILQIFYIEKSTLYSIKMPWSLETFEADLKKIQDYPLTRNPICLN